MNQDAQEYLNREYAFFQKAYELQFDHFMKVFYFWTSVIVIPITAGLLNDGVVIDPTSQTYSISKPYSILLLVVSALGFFLAAKMYDIRCAELGYLDKLNKVRAASYKGVKMYITKDYRLPYPENENLQHTAFHDFGIWMAFTMSALDAAIFGFSIKPVFLDTTGFSSFGAIAFFFAGMATYRYLVRKKVPDGKTKEL